MILRNLCGGLPIKKSIKPKISSKTNLSENVPQVNNLDLTALGNIVVVGNRVRNNEGLQRHRVYSLNRTVTQHSMRNQCIHLLAQVSNAIIHNYKNMQVTSFAPFWISVFVANSKVSQVSAMSSACELVGYHHN